MVLFCSTEKMQQNSDEQRNKLRLVLLKCISYACPILFALDLNRRRCIKIDILDCHIVVTSVFLFVLMNCTESSEPLQPCRQNCLPKVTFTLPLQVNEVNSKLSALPSLALLSAAFITYLSASPEDVRRNQLTDWSKQFAVLGLALPDTIMGVENTNAESCIDIRRFLTTEREQLMWRNQGLPSDRLSGENAVVILEVSVSFIPQFHNNENCYRGF